MPAEVIDPPATADTPPVATPPGETNFGDRYRDALAKGDSKEKAPAKAEADKTPPPVVEKKKADATPTKPSALDIAIGDKPAEAKPEVIVDEPDDILKQFEDIKVPKSEHWERARATMRTQSDEKKTLRLELEKAKGELGKIDPKTAENLTLTAKERDDLKGKNAELLDVITKINVKYSPDYQEKFVKGREKLLERAANRVKEYGGDIEKFNDALSLTGKYRTQALKEALVEVDDLDKPRIISVLDQIQALDDEGAELDKNPKHAFEELEAKRREQHERLAADNERARKSEFEKVDHSLKTNSVTLRIVGDTQWDDEIKAAFSRADIHFTNDAPISKLREIAVKGERFDGVEKMLLDKDMELRAASKLLREYEESAPDFRGSGKKPDTTVAKTPIQKYNETLAAAQGGGDDGV